MNLQYQIGEYVFYESGGICLIKDIQISPLDGMPADKTYYVMQSVHDKSGVLYVPVESDRIYIRKLSSRAEAERLLTQIEEIAPIIESNGKVLRTKYLEAMHTHEPMEWVRIIKTAYFRKNENPDRIQRLSEAERVLVARVKNLLCAELSLALSISEREVADLLESRLYTTKV